MKTKLGEGATPGPWHQLGSMVVQDKTSNIVAEVTSRKDGSIIAKAPLLIECHHALTCAALALPKLLEIKFPFISPDLREEFQEHVKLIRGVLVKLESEAMNRYQLTNATARTAHKDWGNKYMNWGNHKQNCFIHHGKLHYMALDKNNSWHCAKSIKEKREISTKVKSQGEGFDNTYIARGGVVHVRCSQCESPVVCGVPTHERGCPNGEGSKNESSKAKSR